MQHVYCCVVMAECCGFTLQTLNTALIYATLGAPITAAPWDKCLAIYSRLPDCPALLREWKVGYLLVGFFCPSRECNARLLGRLAVSSVICFRLLLFASV